MSSKDGIVDEALWSKVHPERRILHLLKETNGFPGDLRELLRRAPWWALGDWTYGLEHVEADQPVPPFAMAREHAADACRSSAVVNLKKLTGGPSAGDGRTIVEAAKRDIAFLREEIFSIIRPGIVVCGGTIGMVQQSELVQLGKPIDSGGRCYHAGGAVWIDQYHPGAYARSDVRYYGLVCTYQQVLRSS